MPYFNAITRPARMLALLLCVLLLGGCAVFSPVQETEAGTETGIEETDTPETEASGSGPCVSVTDSLYSLADLEEDLEELRTRYAGRMDYRTFGSSADGKPLYAVTLGNPDASRSLLITAAIHGREYITAQVAMVRLEEWLTRLDEPFPGKEGSTYRDILSGIRIEIVPMVNPDGVMLSEEGLLSLRSEPLRETVRRVYGSDCEAGVTRLELEDYLQYWKANANGTDLNRNYDADWASYKGMYLPSMANYKGPSPASEPETKAMTALASSLPGLLGVLCLHTQGEIVYWNCDPEISLPKLPGWAGAAARKLGYKLDNEPKRDASLSDWAVLELGIPAITVEVGTGLSPVDPSQMGTILTQTEDLFEESVRYLTHAAG